MRQQKGRQPKGNADDEWTRRMETKKWIQGTNSFSNPAQNTNNSRENRTGILTQSGTYCRLLCSKVARCRSRSHGG